MPKLVLRIGRSALRPFTGFMKHQAGTTPSSTLSPVSGLLNRLLFCMKPPSLPTTHQPSSNDWTTVSCSPRLVISSSSGRTGENICLTFRLVPVVGVVSMEELVDMTEKRLRPLEALMNELRNMEERLEDDTSSID